MAIQKVKQMQMAIEKARQKDFQMAKRTETPMVTPKLMEIETDWLTDSRLEKQKLTD